MTTIPRIQIVRHGSGWLVQCRKPGSAPHWEQWTQMRPGADRCGREHERGCKEGGK